MLSAGHTGNYLQAIMRDLMRSAEILLTSNAFFWGGILLNATFNNISVISWLSVLLVEETGVPVEKTLTCRKSLTNFIT
jgi:hypothetical protein